MLGSRLEIGLRSRAPAGTQPGWRLRFRCEVLGWGPGRRQGQVDRRCRAAASGSHCAIVLVRITACWRSTMHRLADRWSHTAPRDTGAGTGAEFARSSVPTLFHVKPQVRISTCDGSNARGRRRSARNWKRGRSQYRPGCHGRQQDQRGPTPRYTHTQKQLGRQGSPPVGGGPVSSLERRGSAERAVCCCPLEIVDVPRETGAFSRPTLPSSAALPSVDSSFQPAVPGSTLDLMPRVTRSTGNQPWPARVAAGIAPSFIP